MTAVWPKRSFTSAKSHGQTPDEWHAAHSDFDSGRGSVSFGCPYLPSESPTESGNPADVKPVPR